ncbi:MAG: response regulator [Gemmatimonadaceae bacterium]|nr:response regulator [Gemmatimonadaceae bacterium]
MGARHLAALLEFEQEPIGIDQWRERLLSKLLFLILLLGSITAIPAMYFAIQRGPKLVTFVDAAALAWIAFIALKPGLSFKIRAYSLVTLNYVVGVWFLFAVGTVSQIYLLAFPIFCALFLGLRPGLYALALNAITLAGFGWLINANIYITGLATLPLMKWIIIALNFTFIDSVLTISAAILLHRLQGSLESQQLAAKALENKHRELTDEIEGRKRAEEATARLVRAVEQAHESILMSDAEGKVVYLNRAFEALSGASRESMPNFWLHQLRTSVSEPDSIATAMRERREWSGSVTLGIAGGEERELEVTISPTRNKSGEVTNFVAVMRDVTRERQMEMSLRQTQKLESVGILAGGIAHDFNNIVGSILGIAEMAQLEVENTSLEDGMSSIVVACKRARDIVRQLMAFSKKSSFERSAISIKRSVEEVLPLLRAVIPSNIEISTNLATDALVAANPAEIQQIIMNLCMNAFQAMAKGRTGLLGIHLRLVEPNDRLWSSRSSLDAYSRLVCLEISDTGPGIPPQDLEHIFDPFFTTKTDIGGTGLGLASVHGIVTSLQGEIVVDTKVGAGTTFQICFAEIDPGEQLNSPTPLSAHLPDEGRILVVDDEQPLLMISSRILCDVGYDVETAESGEVALQMFDADPFRFDLIITDLTMSGMSGTELIRELKKRRPDLPTILASGFADPKANEGSSLNVESYLQKPYTRRELLEMVRMGLGRKTFS